MIFVQLACYLLFPWQTEWKWENVILVHGKDEKWKEQEKQPTMSRARGKLGSSWLLATTVSMVFLILCSSFSSSVIFIIIVIINSSIDRNYRHHHHHHDHTWLGALRGSFLSSWGWAVGPPQGGGVASILIRINFPTFRAFLFLLKQIRLKIIFLLSSFCVLVLLLLLLHRLFITCASSV